MRRNLATISMPDFSHDRCLFSIRLTMPSGHYRRFTGDESFLDMQDTQISRDGSEVDENDGDQSTVDRKPNPNNTITAPGSKL